MSRLAALLLALAATGCAASSSSGSTTTAAPASRAPAAPASSSPAPPSTTTATTVKADPAKVSVGGSVEIPDVAGYRREAMKTAVLGGVTVQRTHLITTDENYEIVVKEFPATKAADGKAWTPAGLATAIRSTYSDQANQFGPDRNDPGIGPNLYRNDGTWKWRYVFLVSPGGTGLSVSFIGLATGYDQELAPKEKPFLAGLRFTGKEPA